MAEQETQGAGEDEVVDDAIHAERDGVLLCGCDPAVRRRVPLDRYPTTDVGGAYCWSCLTAYDELRRTARRP